MSRNRVTVAPAEETSVRGVLSMSTRLPAVQRVGLWAWLAAVLFGSIVFALLWWTELDYGYAIDEATYVWVAREERAWFGEIGEKGLFASFTPEAIDGRWHFLEPPTGEVGKHSNFNLPLSMHLLNLGWLVGSWFTDELTSYRLSSMVLLSICAADVLRTIGRWIGWPGGVFAAISLVAMPRVFGHGHLAATETPLSCFWLMTCMALVRMTRSESGVTTPGRGAPWIAAILLGLTMSVKFTGWFLAPAVLVWLLVFRPGRWLTAAGLSLVLPGILIYALTPNLWHDPVGRMASSIALARENPWTIPTYYLHEGYSSRLPGISGLVLLCVTMPVSVFLLSLVGWLFRIRSPQLWAVGLPTLTLLCARLAGLVPTHDVDRQFLPVYYGMAVIAGIGFDVVVGWIWNVCRLRGSSLPGVCTAVALGAVVFVEPAIDFWQYRSHGLMYYNRAIGGLAGASRMGFEVSYWYEAMSDEEWLEVMRRLPPNARVFSRPDHPGVENLREWGIWREDVAPVGPEEADFYLLYAKRAAYLVPDGRPGRMANTDLGAAAEHDAMDWELRFEGVRLAGLRRVRAGVGE